jgi:hypothetical protein
MNRELTPKLLVQKLGSTSEFIVKGEIRFLIDIDDVKGLSQNVATALTLSDEGRRRMSQSAFNIVINSTWQDSAILFEKALDHACQVAIKGEITGACICPDFK